MAYDEGTARRVRRVISKHAEWTEKKMMGGVCFMVNGKMCCGVSRTSLMIRVGPEAYQQTLTQPHVRPLEIGGRRPRGFVLVDSEGYRTEAALTKWIRRGLDFTSTLLSKNQPSKKSRTSLERKAN